MKAPPTLGLVLTGGGARGAYQAGVLRAIAERLGPGRPLPFRVLTGVSAGAINAAFLAAQAQDFRSATARLWELWGRLRTNQVFVTNPLALSRTAGRVVAELGLGGLVRGERRNHLLDTAPLRRLLEANLDPKAIARHLADGTVSALALTATSYGTGMAVTFFDGAPGAPPWVRSARITVRTPLSVPHVMASSALPVFFRPEPIAGTWYGDGCIRLTTPLSAAIHLGADRVLAIGVRHLRPPEATRKLHEACYRTGQPPLAEIGGVLLNAVFLDALETDLERARRINATVAQIPQAQCTALPLRQLPLEAIRPSKDLGTLVPGLLETFPLSVRHLMRGLGASRGTGSDLLSYLAFDQSYTLPLLELGYADGLASGAAFDALFSFERDAAAGK